MRKDITLEKRVLEMARKSDDPSGPGFKYSIRRRPGS
jgi:hypothetical protein